ncbi:MAG: VOC family protein [Pseudomonadota bacterium]
MHCHKLLTATVLVCLLVGCSTLSPPNLDGMTFSDEPLIGKAIWYDLVTEDPDAAVPFYEGLFGWRFEPATAVGGPDYRVARLGDVFIAGMVAVESRADGREQARWLPYISVADVDASVNVAVREGGSVAASARSVPLGRVAAIIDPEGAVIGLASSTIGDPDDATTAAGPGKIVWTELLSNDPLAAAAFYQAVVDYDVRTIQRRGGDYTLLGQSAIDRAGILQTPVAEWSPVWLTYFGVPDAAAAAARAEALGGQILIPSSPELRDGAMSVVEDPTGALLVLQQWSRTGM